MTAPVRCPLCSGHGRVDSARCGRCQGTGWVVPGVFCPARPPARAKAAAVRLAGWSLLAAGTAAYAELAGHAAAWVRAMGLL